MTARPPLWLRHRPGSALSRWLEEPLKRSDHFDARAAKRRPCGRAIFQNDSPPIVAPPELPPSQICHPAEKRRTMSRRSIPPHRRAASNLQLTSDRGFRHQLSGVSLPPPRRGQPRPILATQGRVTAVSVTGSCRQAPRISASVPGPLIYEETLARWPLPLSGPLVCERERQADPAAIKTSRLIVRGRFEQDGDNRALTSSRTAQRSALGSAL